MRLRGLCASVLCGCVIAAALRAPVCLCSFLLAPFHCGWLCADASWVGPGGWRQQARRMGCVLAPRSFVRARTRVPCRCACGAHDSAPSQCAARTRALSGHNACAARCRGVAAARGARIVFRPGGACTLCSLRSYGGAHGRVRSLRRFHRLPRSSVARYARPLLSRLVRARHGAAGSLQRSARIDSRSSDVCVLRVAWLHGCSGAAWRARAVCLRWSRRLFCSSAARYVRDGVSLT